MKFVPHPYQRYCINRMLAEPNLGLFLDPGLGKTVITMTVVNDLRYNRFQIGKALVIAPKKVAEDTWMREQKTWDHLSLLRVMPVLGSQQKRIKALNTPADIYVTSRDTVQWLVDYYRNDWPFDMVVIDELSSFKNPSSKRFRKLKLVLGHIKRLVGLTGTPAPNGLIDLWSQVYLLDRGERLGATIGAYRERYFNPGRRNRDTIFNYELLPGAEELIRRQIQDICISMQAQDYLQLPEKISNVRYIQLSPASRKKYAELEKTMLLEIDETTIDAASAAALSNKLLQLCNGAIYDGDRNVIEIHEEKIEAFREMLEAYRGRSMLVFYNFQHDRERLLKLLAREKLQVRELKDSETITQWNSGEIDVLLAHPASAAYGLNLQAGGSIVVWFGMNWSLELYQQANARLHRQGQKEAVIINHLVVAGGIDERVMEVLGNKQATQASLLTALKARILEVKEGA